MTNQILLINIEEGKLIPIAESLDLVGDGANIKQVTDKEEAKNSMNTMADLSIIISNAASFELFELARAKHPKAQTILVTDLPMVQYSPALKSEEHSLVDHVIANRVSKDWTVNELKITIEKLITTDIFGIEKYLEIDTPIERRSIKGSSAREIYNAEVMAFAEKCRLGHHTAKTAFGITEELLMNVIHDAPLAGGVREYQGKPRTAPVDLKPEYWGELTWGCDGHILAIGAADPFGALKKEKLARYIRKLLKRDDSSALIDTKKEGAGLGFFKMLYSSHGLVCNVCDGKKTEIITLIEVKEQLRDFSTMARSIHFFSSTTS